jgi:hypothetical protein
MKKSDKDIELGAVGEQERHELRKKWRQYWQEFIQVCEERKKEGYRSQIPYPGLPQELRGLTCGAKTRKGTPCKIKNIYHNGRCKLHGGYSTGPKTVEGKRRSAINGKKPKRSKPHEGIQNCTT